MIAALDGRAAIGGRTPRLGHPADRALLRELRASVDAVLVGSRTLTTERYANLLDADHRERRVARGVAPHPLVATISRGLGVDPSGVGLFAEDVGVAVYTEAAGRLEGRGARVSTHRLDVASPAAVLEDLHGRHGARTVLCEGGPALLRELVADDLVDDLLLTLAPMLVGGDAPAILDGPMLDAPRRLTLERVLRADDHLVLVLRAR